MTVSRQLHFVLSEMVSVHHFKGPTLLLLFLVAFSFETEEQSCDFKSSHVDWWKQKFSPEETAQKLIDQMSAQKIEENIKYVTYKCGEKVKHGIHPYFSSMMQDFSLPNLIWLELELIWNKLNTFGNCGKIKVLIKLS